MYGMTPKKSESLLRELIPAGESSGSLVGVFLVVYMATGDPMTATVAGLLVWLGSLTQAMGHQRKARKAEKGKR